MKWFEGLTWETKAKDVGWVWVWQGALLLIGLWLGYIIYKTYKEK